MRLRSREAASTSQKHRDVENNSRMSNEPSLFAVFMINVSDPKKHHGLLQRNYLRLAVDALSSRMIFHCLHPRPQRLVGRSSPEETSCHGFITMRDPFIDSF